MGVIILGEGRSFCCGCCRYKKARRACEQYGPFHTYVWLQVSNFEYRALSLTDGL